MIVLVGLILGVGVLTLDKFEQVSAMTSNTSLILNASRDAISPIASSWMPLIITIAVLAIILTLVIKSFAFNR